MAEHRTPPPTRSALGKVLAVAWREFKTTALTKAFLFGAIVVPILVWGAIALTPLLMRSEPPPLEGTLAIVDPTGRVADEALKRFEELSARSSSGTSAANPIAGVATAANAMQPGTDPSELLAAIDGPRRVRIGVLLERDPSKAAELEAAVRAGTYLGLATVDPGLLEADPGGARLALLVPGSSSPKHTAIYERILRDATVRARVDATGGDYAALTAILKRPDLDTRRLTAEGGTAKEKVEARMLIPIAFMMLLWISTFSSGNYLLTTTIEEKSNKVMEVLLSAVSPMQLLAGKILGQALVCVVILVLYGGLAFAGLTALAMADLLRPILLVYLVVYFVMAYFMVATMMAAVGSAVSDLREAQALITPAMLILIVPLILWFPISDNPNGLLATITSFIPPLTPFVMILRISGSAEPVPAWQIALSIVWGFAATLGMLWMAARIFRVGILMQGKPPSPLELLRWATYR